MWRLVGCGSAVVRVCSGDYRSSPVVEGLPCIRACSMCFDSGASLAKADFCCQEEVFYLTRSVAPRVSVSTGETVVR